MQTSLSQDFVHTSAGIAAEKILRKCVHCGFCNAACPTYQLLGDELDGPRGRIYQIKLLLEGAEPTGAMRRHLDRCLTCRACETTCPSGVRYSELLEVGRDTLDKKLPRTGSERWARKFLAEVVSRRNVFGLMTRLGRMFKSVVPPTLSSKIPQSANHPKKPWPSRPHQRRMVVLAGCVQPTLTPNVNFAAATLLDRNGISLIEAPGAGCCGAVHLHTSAQDAGRRVAKKLIDIWSPYLDQGIEAFIVTASGCGITVKEYPHLFKGDSHYYPKALRMSEKTFDLSEILEKEKTLDLHKDKRYQRIAFHSPCTLQHGQQIRHKVEKLLRGAGYQLCEVKDSHLCCGSAGTYSILQPDISDRLRMNKQKALNTDGPDAICTANVGCQTQLQIESKTPVLHWIELLA